MTGETSTADSKDFSDVSNQIGSSDQHATLQNVPLANGNEQPKSTGSQDPMNNEPVVTHDSTHMCQRTTYEHIDVVTVNDENDIIEVNILSPAKPFKK